jgi:hypothetical protein
MYEPVLSIVGEEIVNFESSFLTSPIVANHECKLGSEVSSEQPRHRSRCSTLDSQVHFVVATYVKIECTSIKTTFECGLYL